MRLIDADEIVYSETLRRLRDGNYYHDYHVWDGDIDKMPTVKAIPVEWIENYLRNYRYMAPIEKSFVREMIKAWAERKEL